MITVLATPLGRSNTRRLAVGAALCVASLTIAVGPALAAAPAVFRNIPTTLPGNVPSQAFQATSTSEFGDLIQLAAGERSSANLPVTVVMSSWGCETGGDDTCVTTPGATWNQALTLTLYAVDHSGAVPAAATPSILTKTQTFAIPYRPSYVPDGPCPPDVANHFYRWYSATEHTCYNGLAHPVTFELPAGVTLPDELIWSLSFNTETHGYTPTGKPGPWNSLNVGAQTFSGQPVVGTDVEPASAFLNSTWSGAYGDNGAAGLGTFRYDPTGWGDNAPLVCFGSCPINLAAATPAPTVVPTVTATPIESFAGATASNNSSPTEVVGGATGTPRSATPPPTSSNSPSDGGSSGLLALLISLGFGSVGLFAVGAQRRTMRR